jgi:hypothetical protein
MVLVDGAQPHAAEVFDLGLAALGEPGDGSPAAAGLRPRDPATSSP